MIDLRSDTVTLPTPEMRRAMAEAEVGDDVFREDPTVSRLQERAAEILGFEAALFVPSGTMGNQIAVRLHTRPGQEVITEARAHIYNWEMASMAAFSGCLARPVAAPRGILTWDLIEPALSPPVYYRAPTGLVALENTHNMAGGTVMSADETQAVIRGARRRGLPVHLDGARIFIPATALGESAASLAAGCDSVMFCLSKGLAAPVGSLLLGSRGFIEEAWGVRKMFGGGMRQVGFLAAAGLVALNTMSSRLAEDHDNAQRLARGLADLSGCRVEPDSVRTNIVMLDLEHRSSLPVLEELRAAGVLAVSTGPRQLRFVTHKDVARRDVDLALEAARRVFT